jgi:Fur family transcriptional regulator, ferric uptake regulator
VVDLENPLSRRVHSSVRSVISCSNELLRMNAAPPALTCSDRSTYTASMPDAGPKCPKQRFLDFLAGKRLRLTAQRRTIVETAFSTTQHFTAEQLLAWSRHRDESVSRATVYRTLPLLTESGLVREMDFGKDHKFYDPNYAEHPHHNHIICQDCDKIVEFESEKLKQIENEISRGLGFSVQSHRLQITAHCEELKQRGTCAKKRT